MRKRSTCSQRRASAVRRLRLSARVLPRELLYRSQPSAELLHKSNCGAALLAFNCYFTTVVILQQLATQLCCRRDIWPGVRIPFARAGQESVLPRSDAQLLISDFINLVHVQLGFVDTGWNLSNKIKLIWVGLGWPFNCQI
jgi:hypothetical protein